VFRNLAKIGFMIVSLLAPSMGWAACKGTPINPITDVCWNCMFPVQIGSNSFGNGDGAAPGATMPPMCVCPSTSGVTTGLSVGFYEISRAIETVKDPYCFPFWGTGLDMGVNGYLQSGSGQTTSTSATDFSVQQVHEWIVPFTDLLNMFTDFPCLDHSAQDIGYMSEPDPTWQDDTLSFILNPEALLFGNPVTQLACVADSVSATVSTPIDALFWCAGSWGGMYPLDGSSTNGNATNANAQLASRMLFKLSRESLLFDTAINYCHKEGDLTPIMVKSHYRLQIARPQRGIDCIPIGRPSMIWGAMKNPAWGTTSNSADNFLWIIPKARTCCVGYTFN
jgi:conjugal transfer pilus assembly protein TraU